MDARKDLFISDLYFSFHCVFYRNRGSGVEGGGEVGWETFHKGLSRHLGRCVKDSGSWQKDLTPSCSAQETSAVLQQTAVSPHLSAKWGG